MLGVISVKVFLPSPYINKELENEFWIKKTFSKTHSNVVIGGDSRTYRGLSPKALKSTIGKELSIVNLGYSDGGFGLEYLQFLHQRLDTTAEQPMLILGITPLSLTKNSADSKHLKSIQNKTKSEIFSGLYFASFLKHFPPYKPYELFDDSTEAYVIDYQTNGFAASNHSKGDFELTYYIYWDIFQKTNVNDTVIQNLTLELKKYVDQGIAVYCYAPPTPERMRKIEAEGSGLNWEAFITKLKNAGVNWINVEPTKYKSYDGSHIYAYDAHELSLYIGKQISASLNLKKPLN